MNEFVSFSMRTFVIFHHEIKRKVESDNLACRYWHSAGLRTCLSFVMCR